jgi:hypothetical protein
MAVLLAKHISAIIKLPMARLGGLGIVQLTLVTAVLMPVELARVSIIVIAI